MTFQEADKYRAPALEKGLDILEYLANCDRGMTQNELVQALGRSQSELYRMLTTLVRRGYVVRSDSDLYALSLKMFAMTRRHLPVSRLTEIALPLMREATVESWQSCHLGVENNGNIVVISLSEAPGNWGLALRPGAVIGLANTGTGRVLAAFRTPRELNHLLAQHRLATGEPAFDTQGFLQRLEIIRARGYEMMPSETLVGVTNLSFPIMSFDGTAIAALSCPYLERKDAFDTPRVEDVRTIYAALAQRISLELQGESY